MNYSSRIEECIETLCQHGCRAVNLYIRDLEQGYITPYTAHLTLPEREQVLTELRAIMAVYHAGGSCSMIPKNDPSPV